LLDIEPPKPPVPPPPKPLLGDLFDDPRPPLPNGPLPAGDLLDEPNGDLPLLPIAEEEDEPKGLLEPGDLLDIEPPKPPVPPPPKPLLGDLFDDPRPPLNGDLLPVEEPKGDLDPVDDEPKGALPSFVCDMAPNTWPNMPSSSFLPSFSPIKAAAPKLAAAANTAIPGTAYLEISSLLSPSDISTLSSSDTSTLLETAAWFLASNSFSSRAFNSAASFPC